MYCCIVVLHRCHTCTCTHAINVLRNVTDDDEHSVYSQFDRGKQAYSVPQYNYSPCPVYSTYNIAIALHIINQLISLLLFDTSNLISYSKWLARTVCMNCGLQLTVSFYGMKLISSPSLLTHWLVTLKDWLSTCLVFLAFFVSNCLLLWLFEVLFECVTCAAKVTNSVLFKMVLLSYVESAYISHKIWTRWVADNGILLYERQTHSTLSRSVFLKNDPVLVRIIM